MAASVALSCGGGDSTCAVVGEPVAVTESGGDVGFRVDFTDDFAVTDAQIVDASCDRGATLGAVDGLEGTCSGYGDPGVAWIDDVRVEVAGRSFSCAGAQVVRVERGPDAPPPGSQYPVRVLHLADTHILTGGDCGGNNPADGRTSCLNPLENYVDDWERWVDEGASILPTVALSDAVPAMNALQPDHVVAAGDLVAVSVDGSDVHPDCGPNHRSSLELYRDLMSGVDAPVWSVAARAHDLIGVEACRDNHEEVLGAPSWNFLVEDALFVGLSEVGPGDGARFDTAYLDGALDAWAGRGMTAFVVLHTPMHCYDAHLGRDSRCSEDEIGAVLRRWAPLYRAIVVLGGHTHATQRAPHEEHLGIYHTIVGALMNYPTEFRVIDIERDRVQMWMSGSVSPEVDDVSLEILREHPRGWDPRTTEGEDWERAFEIPL